MTRFVLGLVSVLAFGQLLRMPKLSSYEIDVSSVTGTIENLFSKARPITGREGRGMELGTGGSAGAPHVTIRTFKGNVKIAAR